jgi:hypothetical protein
LSSLKAVFGLRACTRREDIPLPLGYPIGLADQRKPLVKFSLIIVNAAIAMIGASGSTYDDQKSALKTPIFRSIAAGMRPSEAQRPQAHAQLLNPVGNSFFDRFGGANSAVRAP